MDKIRIGLFKHKETGEYDAMVSQINNTCKVYNGEFDLIKEFNHTEYSEAEKEEDRIFNDEIRELHNEVCELLEMQGMTKNPLLRDNLIKSEKRKLQQILDKFDKKIGGKE